MTHRSSLSVQRIAVLSVHTSPLAALGGEKTGGMNVYIRDFSRQLARRGIQVDIYTRRQSTHQPQIEMDQVAGVRVIHVCAGLAEAISVNEVPRYLDHFTTGVLDFAQQQGIHYDLIHSHYWLSGIVAEQLRAAWQIPFVQMFHTLGHMKNAIARSDRERATQDRLDGELRVVRSADRLIAATPTEQEQLIEWYGADAAKISIISPGIDLAHFQPLNKNLARDFLAMPRERKQILFTGRIEPLKGIDSLLKAVALIQGDSPELLDKTQVTIIGGEPLAVQRNPEMVNLQELRCQLELCDTVQFVGAKDQTQLPLYYAASDMVVMPSHYESFGLVALEAMAMGTPVIASNVGGLAHLVQDGETGFLVPRNDPKKLAARISDLLANDQFRDQLGEQAAHHAQNYDWQQIVERMLNEVYLPLVRQIDQKVERTMKPHSPRPTLVSWSEGSDPEPALRRKT